jgi:hypothetical protein
MPSTDFDLLDIFQTMGPPIVDNPAVLPAPQPPIFHQESNDILDMLPALGRSALSLSLSLTLLSIVATRPLSVS